MRGFISPTGELCYLDTGADYEHHAMACRIMGLSPEEADRAIYHWTTADTVLTRALGLPVEHAEALTRAIRRVALQSSGGSITVYALMTETAEDPEFLKLVLGTLLLARVLRGRFIPYHRRCDQEIGPDEPSAEIIREKASSGLYPTLCPYCHEYLDGVADVVIRILFFLPLEGA